MQAKKKNWIPMTKNRSTYYEQDVQEDSSLDVRWPKMTFDQIGADLI